MIKDVIMRGWDPKRAGTGPAEPVQHRAAALATGPLGFYVVTSKRESGNDVSISDRARSRQSVDRPSPVISSMAEFSDLIELFVQAWPRAGQTEKVRLLVHHWLDALACWSMEDLYLSATTLLQIIVATEAGQQGKKELPFYAGVADAAKRMSIRTLSDDFKNMRNELIHDGRLIGNRFAGPDKGVCAAVVADVLNWFDEYLHAASGSALHGRRASAKATS
jgi:hypothetical protein